MKLLVVTLLSLAALAAQPMISSVLLTSQNSNTPGDLFVYVVAADITCEFRSETPVPAAQVSQECFTQNSRGPSMVNYVATVPNNTTSIVENQSAPSIRFGFTAVPTVSTLPATCKGPVPSYWGGNLYPGDGVNLESGMSGFFLCTETNTWSYQGPVNPNRALASIVAMAFVGLGSIAEWQGYF
jgi:hypothetical protein